MYAATKMECTTVAAMSIGTMPERTEVPNGDGQQQLADD
jgi:hypothetical protein